MNVYKYQIIKYLETKNFNIKELKTLSKEELLKKYKNIDKNDLSIYLNKRKQRQMKTIIHDPSKKTKIIIDWNHPFLEL
jgi:hypothetical protein